MSVAASKPPEEQPGAQIESQGDRFETLIEYNPTAKVPVVVVLVWACALVGLGIYMVTFLFPELTLYGKP